jgi:hypothetical protein
MKVLFELGIKGEVVNPELTRQLDYLGAHYIIFRNVKGPTL